MSESEREKNNTGVYADVTPADREAAEAPVGPVARWAIHRRLYDWVLSLAHKKHSTLALAAISFAESSFFLIPPDVLLAPLCLGNRKKAMWFATVTTVSSVLGAYLGYLIGAVAIEWILAIHIPGLNRESVDALAAHFDKSGEVYVFIAALTPIPFKLLTITAGSVKMNLAVFTIACLVGRATRFYAVAGLFWLIGPKAMPIIDKYFNVLCVLFVVLAVGGLLAVKLMNNGETP